MADKQYGGWYWQPNQSKACVGGVLILVVRMSGLRAMNQENSSLLPA